MNRAEIKNFAVSARNKLIEDISQNIYELGIGEDSIKDIEIFEDGFKIRGLKNSKIYESYKAGQRENLILNIKKRGLNQLVEETAYIWFNRFISIHFMEVNEFLPMGINILPYIKDKGEIRPDIIEEVSNNLNLSKRAVDKLVNGNDIEDLYKYIIVKQCDELNRIMPAVFGKISGYTQLLLPGNLLSRDSIIKNLLDMDKEIFKDNVEVIGWMYQYYILDKKDEIFENLKRDKSKKIRKDDIPAVTQLFTPKWIVKYMLQNSLGRLLLDKYPGEGLKSQWEYYLEGGEKGSPEWEQGLSLHKKTGFNLEDIKILDPAMGSGHILVYAFDMLYNIYSKANYPREGIPQLILEKNLYGLDIDDRAARLAIFALLMKARSKDKDIFEKNITLNVCSIQESRLISKEAVDYFVYGNAACSLKEDKKDQIFPSEGGMGEGPKEDIKYLLDIFYDAKEYGSILNIEKIDFSPIEKRLREIQDQPVSDLYDFLYRETILEQLPPLIKQAKIMAGKYHVVCANPPYSGFRKLNDKLKNFIEDNYRDYKYDLFSVFTIKILSLTKEGGYIGLMTPDVWQFISSYKNLRRLLINNYQLINLIQLEDDGFKDASVSISTFVIKKDFKDARTTFLKLRNCGKTEQQSERVKLAIKNDQLNRYRININKFKNLPGFEIAYWASQNTIGTFELGRKLGDIAKPRQGMATSNNDKFLRLWYEVPIESIDFNASYEDRNLVRWVPYNKGGGYRKWYGNQEYIINWENDGFEVKQYAEQLYNNASRTIKNEKFYFREGITYSFIGKYIGPRFTNPGFIFDVAGSTIFIEDKDRLLYILALLASKISNHYMDILNPTINIQVGDLKVIPIIETKDKQLREEIKNIAVQCIKIAKEDWDSFETSWNFKVNPVIGHKTGCSTIEGAYESWSNFKTKQFQQLKEKEERLNSIFIEIYGLQKEINKEVEEKHITISKANRVRDIKLLISYAVGCMFGRYSLDEEGLIYAGGQFEDRFKLEGGKLKINIRGTWQNSSIDVVADNVIPISHGEYFEDDIANRFLDFIKVAFGQGKVEENIQYIADILGRSADETAIQAIRRYFIKDFYLDHIRLYKNRPIYWLFDSGKENGFKALVYMHRYSSTTAATIKTDYLDKIRKKYKEEINQLDNIIHWDASPRDKDRALRQKEVINRQILECNIYNKMMYDIINYNIEIDLKDGVKSNYSRLQDVLAAIKF